MLPFRKALPGDICLLLQPDHHQAEQLKQKQQRLIHEYGGKQHQVLHFTIQRFEMDTINLPSFIVTLKKTVSKMDSLPVFGTGLQLSYHKFWDANLLRWTVQQEPTLNNLLRLMEKTIVMNNGIVHYPLNEGWHPSLITAIESPNENFPKEGIVFDEPQKIFCCNQLIVSEIISNERFKIHGTFTLGKN